MKTLLNAANVIASIAGTVAAETVTGGAGTAISGTTSLYELIRRVSGKAPAITAKIAQDLQAELDRHHLTDDQKLLVIQMVEYAPLLPAEVMAAARNPTRICATMLAKLKDPAHRSAPTQDAFTRVLVPVLTLVLADTEVSSQLRPAFEDATAETLRFIAEQVETLTAQVQGAFERAAIAEFVVKELARRFVPGSGGDFESARRDLEKALEIYTTQQAIGALPHNHHEAIDTVFDEVNRLNRLAQFDEASAALDAALRIEQEAIKTQQEASNARQAAILDRGVDQDRLRNNPVSAAERLVARLLLDNPPAPFHALRALQDDWYERGRDLGLAFDATVAIHLAEHSLTRAQPPDQRGAALNDLAIALQTLGEREPGTARLEAAVLAYTAALQEYTRDRVPLQWATTQMNLGSSLATLGEREPGTARLDAAVLAFTAALQEFTRDRVPLKWATTQMNLGSALLILGQREPGTTRLDAAVQAYTAALQEFTRDRVPLEWAGTQMNLGNALLTLGEREPDTARLDAAVLAYTAALQEFTRDRVPLDWATAQMNLGTALQALGERESGTARLDAAVLAYTEALKEFTRDRVPLQWANVHFNLADLERAYFDKTANPSHLATTRSYALAAREVFVAAQAELYVQMADKQLAQIAARTP
jgi:tetratricopeptide (TPR) repeat protein